MAHKAEGGSGGGYPRFDDPGGPVGSDLDNLGTDKGDPIKRVLAEVADPIPSEIEGQLLKNGDGSIAKMNLAALQATRACQMTINAAQGQINLGVPVSEVMVEIGNKASDALVANFGRYGTATCDIFCLKAFFKNCPLQEGGIRGVGKSALTPFTEESFSDLIGILPMGSRVRTVPSGRAVFEYFLNHGLGTNNGYNPVPLDIDGVDSSLAQQHISHWTSKYRAKTTMIVPAKSHSEQLVLDL